MKRIARLASRPDQDTILTLEELLADARDARVGGIIIAAHYDQGDIGLAGAGVFCRQRALGAAAILALQAKFLL